MPVRPARLPDGRPWPTIRVLIPEDASPETLASIERQDYPEHRIASSTASTAHEATPSSARGRHAGAGGADGARPRTRAERASAWVAGCACSMATTVIWPDVPGLDARLDEADGILFTAVCGDRLVVPLTRGQAADRTPRDPAARAGAPARRRSPSSRSRERARSAARGSPIAVCPRRWSLAHHRVTHEILSTRTAAAEWTDRFPEAEARIAVARPDFVLVGNVHGATRSLDVVGRLAGAYPTALVLHDLFALKGAAATARLHPRRDRLRRHLPHPGRVPAPRAEADRGDARPQARRAGRAGGPAAAGQFRLDAGAQRSPRPRRRGRGPSASPSPRAFQPRRQGACGSASACPRATCSSSSRR